MNNELSPKARAIEFFLAYNCINQLGLITNVWEVVSDRETPEHPVAIDLALRAAKAVVLILFVLTIVRMLQRQENWFKYLKISRNSTIRSFRTILKQF